LGPLQRLNNNRHITHIKPTVASCHMPHATLAMAILCLCSSRINFNLHLNAVCLSTVQLSNCRLATDGQHFDLTLLRLKSPLVHKFSSTLFYAFNLTFFNTIIGLLMKVSGQQKKKYSNEKRKLQIQRKRRKKYREAGHKLFKKYF